MATPRTGFWVFVSNPCRFPIDKFIRERLPPHTDDPYNVWTVPKSDDFQPGDLGLVRTVKPVKPNKRTEAQLNDDGASGQLAAGIYAVCEVTGKPSDWKAGKNDDLWRPQDKIDSYSRSKNWRQVPIKYLWSSLTNPLLVADLKEAIPDLKPPRQGQHCFPISEEHFQRIVDRLRPTADRDAIKALAQKIHRQ